MWKPWGERVFIPCKRVKRVIGHRFPVARGKPSSGTGALIVEDSLFIRKTLVSILKNNEIDVCDAVSSIKDARKAFEKHHPSIVMLDLILEDGHGLDLLTEFKEQKPEIPVIVVSSVNDKRIIAKALNKGASDFLIKPVSKHRTVLTIRKLLDPPQIKSMTNLAETVALYNEFIDGMLQHASDLYHDVVQDAVAEALEKAVNANSGRLRQGDNIAQILPKRSKAVSRPTLARYLNMLSQTYIDIVNALRERLSNEVVELLIKDTAQTFYVSNGELIEATGFDLPATEVSDRLSTLFIPLRRSFRKKAKPLQIAPRPRKSGVKPTSELTPQHVVVFLSYFDEIEGPIALSQAPMNLEENIRAQTHRIPNLMDMEGIPVDGTFVNATNDFATTNFYFRLLNKDARGSEEEFLLSIAIVPCDFTNMFLWAPSLMELLQTAREELPAAVDLIRLARRRPDLRQPLHDYLASMQREVENLIRKPVASFNRH